MSKQIIPDNISKVIKPQKKWAFPTVSKCPRCGATETKATHTDSKLGRQYRQCQRGICRKNYSVEGTEV
jgi:transcription elongation factor Elf1